VKATAQALHAIGVEVELGPPQSAADGQPDFYDQLARPVDSRTAVHIAFPDLVNPVAGKLNANFTMFEADRIADIWLQHNLTHDLVIVPTDSSRQAWVNSGYPKSKIRLCPLAVDPVAFSGKAPPLALRFEDGELVANRRTRFLNVSELGSRKNLVGLMRTWLRATTPKDNAALILKVGCYFPNSQAVFAQNIQTAEQQAQKKRSEAAPICFVLGKMGEGNLPRLFTSATHYLSMSLGEGWDFPMVEAAASGLRLIAPRHSAYTEYLDSSIASLIPATAVRADFRGYGPIAALFVGGRWWLPDETSAAQYIREAIDGRDTHKRPARDRIVSKYNWTNYATRLMEIVEELENPPKKLRFFGR
jgi:glycosyltransferase involved in cell wall biosynthesis